MNKLNKNFIRIRHMLDATNEALSFVAGSSRSELDDNRMLALAIVKDIEIIGEAASKVDQEFQAAHPEIPWKLITRTRNRLIHGYFDVNLDTIWETVQKSLPPLAESLEKVIKLSVD